jgi:hypothetical protein
MVDEEGYWVIFRALKVWAIADETPHLEETT